MNIKAMNENMQCRGFQFEIGKEYKIDTQGKPLELCSDTVFHYCKSLKDVHHYYNCRSPYNRFFEIEVLGDEVTDGKKCGSNHIKIVREIIGEELLCMKGLVNGNTGLFNTGYNNTGNCNTGNCNTGDHNTGDRNAGDRNAGDENTGCYNMGFHNTGLCNVGDYNTGFGNTTSGSNGIFCTKPDEGIKIFNKPSGMCLQEFYSSKFFKALMSVPFNLEKVNDHSDAMQEAWANWWAEMTDENREIIKQIPNFDEEIFKEITGIEV